MVWPFSSGKSNTAVDETPSTEQEKPASSQKFLEDLPPKFDEASPATVLHNRSNHGIDNRSHDARSAYKVDGDKIMIPGLGTIDPHKSPLQQAASTVSFSDFSKVNEIPCFRKAMMTGGAIAFVAFGVLVSTRSPMKRAMNWAVGGFTIGAIGSWEQCRFKIRQEKKNQQMAREIYRNKGSNENP